MPKFFPLAANQIRRSFCFVRKYLFFKNKFAKIDKKLLTNDNSPATLRTDNYCFAIIFGGAYRV